MDVLAIRGGSRPRPNCIVKMFVTSLPLCDRSLAPDSGARADWAGVI
jgi:hypothetical protein